MATSNAPESKSRLYADPREDWLAQRKEEVLDSGRPIVDPHHHLWDRGGQRYMIEEMAADRSEEHTSELQSRSDLVCRLLLEKKNALTSIISTRKAGAAALPPGSAPNGFRPRRARGLTAPLAGFFFNDAATTEIYTLSLHDALPIPQPPVLLETPGSNSWCCISGATPGPSDRKSTRLNSSHDQISYADFCLKQKKANSNTRSYKQEQKPSRHIPTMTYT